MLAVEGKDVVLKGASGLRVFRRATAPVEVLPIAQVGPLLAP